MLGAAFILDDVKARVSFILRTWSNKKRERKKKNHKTCVHAKACKCIMCVFMCVRALKVATCFFQVYVETYEIQIM